MIGGLSTEARWSSKVHGAMSSPADRQHYSFDMGLGEVGGLLCLLVVVVAVIAAGVFIGVRLAQRRR